MGHARLGRSRGGLYCILSVAKELEATCCYAHSAKILLCRTNCYGRAEVEVGSQGRDDVHVD